MRCPDPMPSTISREILSQLSRILKLCDEEQSKLMHGGLDSASFALAPEQDKQRNAEEAEIAYTSEGLQIRQKHGLLRDQPVQHPQRLLLRLNRARSRMNQRVSNAFQALPDRRVI